MALMFTFLMRWSGIFGSLSFFPPLLLILFFFLVCVVGRGIEGGHLARACGSVSGLEPVKGELEGGGRGEGRLGFQSDLGS